MFLYLCVMFMYVYVFMFYVYVLYLRRKCIEGGTPGGLFRTRDGLPKIKKARATRNVHECESVCA